MPQTYRAAYREPGAGCREPGAGCRVPQPVEVIPRAAGRDPLAGHPSRWKLSAGTDPQTPGRDPRAAIPGPMAAAIAQGPPDIGSNAADRGPRAIFQRSRPAVY